MQDRTLKTELLIADAPNELNVFEQFLDEMIDELGIGEKSEGIVLGALVSGFELLAYTLNVKAFTIRVDGNHNGVFFHFVLDSSGFTLCQQMFSNDEIQANVQKMRLLSENIELNSEEKLLSLEFELNSIYSKIAKERSTMLKRYFKSEDSTQNKSHDISKRNRY
jgi:hypothetical protein